MSMLLRRRGIVAQGAAGDVPEPELDEPVAFASVDTVVGLPLIPSGYADAVLDDNPVAYYALDETSGTTAADGVGSNDATYTGRWQLGLDNVLTGDTDKVARAAGGYLTIPSLGHEGDYSVSWLVQLEWFANDVRLWRSAAGHFVRIQNGNLERASEPSWAVIGPHGLSGVQHQVTQFVITRSGSTQGAYVNGVEVDGTATTALDVLNNTLWLGRQFSNAKDMHGRIGRVALFDRALTPTEVANHYAGGA